MIRALPFVLLAACASDPRPAAPRDAAVANVAASPIAISITTTGSWLEVTLRNTSAAPLRLASRVDAGEVHLDWLTVELVDAAGARRTLRFQGDRDESGRAVVELAPGATAVERVDLVAWAIRQRPDAAPIAPGTYTIHASWDASRETDVAAFVATADAPFTLTAPADQRCDVAGYQAPAGAQVQLLAHQVAGGGAIAEIGLHNAGTAPVCVWSHIATHELQHDWLVVQYSDGAKYHHFNRVIALDDDRDKSAPFSVSLRPGETAWHRFDLAAWALRKRNGAEPLPSGSLWGLAVYDTSKEDETWSGRLQQQFSIDVP